MRLSILLAVILASQAATVYVVKAASRAGLERVDEISVVPGHDALRFRKP